jgi:Bacterial archaeo-eukaryotic release factor family 2
VVRTVLDRVAPLYEEEGLVASAYVPLPEPTEDARHQLEIRLRQLAGELEDQGGDRRLVEGLDLPPEAHGWGRTLAIVGRGDRPAVARALDTEVDEVHRVGALPSVVPLVLEEQAEIPHVVVLVDRAGAEIVTYDRDVVDEEQVTGDTRHLHRVRGSGQAHRRLQQRAINTWEHNAAAVADEVAERARAVQARLVYVAGDVRAKGFLAEHLPDDVKAVLEVDPREPQGDGQPFEAIEDDLRRALQTIAARDTVEALEAFAAARAHHEAADGPAATLAALSEARIARLLVHDDPADDRRAWFAPGTPVASVERADLDALDLEPVEARLIDVAVRSAVLTDAEIRVVPGHGPNAPDGGLGGTTRWSEPEVRPPT